MGSMFGIIIIWCSNNYIIANALWNLSDMMAQPNCFIIQYSNNITDILPTWIISIIWKRVLRTASKTNLQYSITKTDLIKCLLYLANMTNWLTHETWVLFMHETCDASNADEYVYFYGVWRESWVSGVSWFFHDIFCNFLKSNGRFLFKPSCINLKQ